MTDGSGPIRVVILGSTGSIGRGALTVIARHPERFRVVALTARGSADALAEQVRRFEPEAAVLTERSALESRDDLPAAEWASGRDALLEVVERDDVDVVLNALVGAAGLEPTIRALEAGHRVALANKESLVVGGPLVLAAAERGGGELVPVDSEHSAILQCLQGYEMTCVQKLVLTASGGPFRGWSREELRHVRPDQALAHPTWDMGAKITVDSATLANKALEVIEGHFLYGVPYHAIEVVVHPQSVIHSFVEFVDGSVLAQVGFPTMELPILYALTYPDRLDDPELRTFDPVTSSPLTFEAVDHEVFPLFGLGVEAGRMGGVAPAVYNAANEVAVEAFLEERISFPGMAGVVGATLERRGGEELTSLEQVLEIDAEARRVAREAVSRASDAGAGGAEATNRAVHDRS